MRIGSYSQIQQIYSMQQTSNTQKSQKKGFSDMVSISGAGKDIQSAKSAVNNAPEVRAELVDSIKARIQAGTYDVDSSDFADRLVEKFSQAF